MDGVGHERVAEGVHLDQRGELAGVAEVVAVLAPAQRRAGRRLDAADHRVHPSGQLLPKERERQAPEVGAAARAAHQHVGGLADLGQLEEGLLADDRLVQEHVVEHAAQGVAGVIALGGLFDGLGDGDAEAARAVRVGGQDGPTGLGQV